MTHDVRALAGLMSVSRIIRSTLCVPATRGLDELEFSRNLKGATREYSTGALMPRRLFAGLMLGFFVLMAAAAVTQAYKVSEQNSPVSATQMFR